MSSDILIVGGGLAGSAAAILLARAGREVMLLEREAQPVHKVCGEFLSREALASLDTLGIDVAALGAVRITAVRFAGRFGVSEATLPFAAMSLTRKRLDEALLLAAERAGAQVVRACAVERLEAEERGWCAHVRGSGHDTIRARNVFQATGKHDLRGLPRAAGAQPDLVAFKMYWRLQPAQAAELQAHVELVLYRGGYAGLQPVEDGLANLCCLVQREELQRLDGRWPELLAAMQRDCPHLQRRLQGATPMLERPLAVSSIPYGFIREHSDGTWALGDQAAVIPSFTGDGMSIALHSGCVGAQMFLAGASAEEYQRQLHAQLRSQVAFATRLSLGMVSQPQRTLMEAAVRLWPGALRAVANRTRIAAPHA